ncbi:MAG: TIGR01458 family HAD-type hydrolase [Halothiobacillaceae bacterium]
MYRGILFDLDGVLYQNGKVIDGARETLAWVRDQSLPHRFVTNTTSRPRAAILDMMQKLGLPARADDLHTPLVAARKWLARHVDGPVACLVRESVRVDLEPQDLLPDEARSGAAAVIVGDLGQDWDYSRLNRAFRLLQDNPDAPLLALGMTRYFRGPDGLCLDSGPFVQALAYATGRSPRVLGKPDAAFFLAAADTLDLPARQVVMVGDDMASDCLAAMDAGLDAILVRTGKFQPADLKGERQPTAVLDSVADLPDWWRRQAS